MNIYRRKTKGTPLLIATAGMGLTISACVGKTVTSGNLMPPPMMELCIEVEPETAEVTIDDMLVADGECTQIYTETAIVEATAEGYQDYSAEVPVVEGTTTHNIEMVPETTADSGEQER